MDCPQPPSLGQCSSEHDETVGPTESAGTYSCTVWRHLDFTFRPVWVSGGRKGASWKQKLEWESNSTFLAVDQGRGLELGLGPGQPVPCLSWCLQSVNQAQLGLWVLEAHMYLCYLLICLLSAVHLGRDSP